MLVGGCDFFGRESFSSSFLSAEIEFLPNRVPSLSPIVFERRCVFFW
jgi:hypothetical protein